MRCTGERDRVGSRRADVQATVDQRRIDTDDLQWQALSQLDG
jgi:hypothetical protein